MTAPTIQHHAHYWTGVELPVDGRVAVCVHPQLDKKTSDGSVVPLVAISSGSGTALGFGPSICAMVEPAIRDLASSNPPEFLARLAQDERFLAAVPKGYVIEYGSIRWLDPSEQAPATSAAGLAAVRTFAPRSWRSPAWIRSFPGPVFGLTDSVGMVISAAGLRPVSPVATELSVETEQKAQGKGLARAVVSAAAASVVEDNRIALYLYRSDNQASGVVADRCGFPDAGWTFLRLIETQSGPQLFLARALRVRGMLFGNCLKVAATVQKVLSRAEK